MLHQTGQVQTKNLQRLSVWL